MTPEDPPSRLSAEALFQDQRMEHALRGETEFRDKFYFINRLALKKYDEFHEPLAGKRVVVTGCSDGAVTPLARRGIYVEGIDISPVSLSKLQRSIEKEGLKTFATTRLMNAEDLEYPENSIDAITCSGVLHHLDTEKALRSWARCLKADGAVLMFEPLAFHPIAALFRLLTPGMRTSDEHPLRDRDFRIMRKYFGHVERVDFGLSTPLAAALAVIPGLHATANILLPVLEYCDSAVLKLVPVARHLCWLTVVRLTHPRIPVSSATL